MHILGVPSDIDPRTVRPTSDWPLSARSQREHDWREMTVTNARHKLDELTDEELRAKAAAELDEELRHMGGGDPPRGFPDASVMAREDMLDFLADRTVGFEPDIEVVYPGPIDPTA
jgi:hypothetical protein